jgi:hypothetical protein
VGLLLNVIKKHSVDGVCFIAALFIAIAAGHAWAGSSRWLPVALVVVLTPSLDVAFKIMVSKFRKPPE